MQDKFLIINESSSMLIISLYEINDNKETKKIKEEKIKKSYFNYELEIKNIINKLKENNYINSINEIKTIGYKIIEKDKEHLNLDEIIVSKETHMLNFIKTIKRFIPDANFVEIIDSTFHKGVPYLSFYEMNNIKTFGINHQSVTQNMKRLAVRDDINIISCYMSEYVSICSVKDGKSENISINVSPLECLDKEEPYIVDFISAFKNITIEETKNILNASYGLKNIASENDLERLIILKNNGNKIAKKGLERFVDLISQNIYTYYTKLNGNISAIILTGTVFEKSKEFRKMIVSKLSKIFNISLNSSDNDKIGTNEEYKEGVITDSKSQIPIFVLHSNEEKIILEETIKYINKEKVVKKLIPNQ